MSLCEDQGLSIDNFFLDSEGLETWQICQALGDFYNVNIVVFDDIKSKKIQDRKSVV